MKTGQRQNEAIHAESEKEATEARATRPRVLAEAEAATKRHREAEASLRELQDQQAAQLQLLQWRED